MRGLFVLSVAALLASSQSSIAADRVWRVYFGTYGQGPSDGIFLAELDVETGALSEPRLAAQAVNASFLALHPAQRWLYAVSEVESTSGKPTGGVVAFALDPKSGSLHRLNGEASQGAGPCHLVVDKTGRNVLVANYDGGTVAVLPLDLEGRVKPASSVIRHQGRGPNPERQEGPHAHSINLDAANRHAFACDLGVDKVFVYRFDPKPGTLAANDPPSASVAPGSGPRHFAFHPNGQFAFAISELANTITAFAYDAPHGILTQVDSVSTLPPGFKGTSYCAEVVVHPSGKFVYGSNRGHDSIAVLSVDPRTGRLTPLAYEPTQGKNPRNFAVDPSGAFLLVANQDSGTVVVYRIDPENGLLKPTGQTVKVPKPVCIKFARAG